MRKAFRTFPGRQLLCGIDKAIDVSQKFLDLIVPEKEKGVKKVNLRQPQDTTLIM